MDEDEKEWITNVFEFDDTPVRDIMVRAGEVIAVSIDATKEEILKLISEEGISAFRSMERTSMISSESCTQRTF